MIDDLDGRLAARNQRAEGHLQDALLKVINHHIYEYPSLTEVQIVGILEAVKLDYHLNGIEDQIAESIIEAIAGKTEEDEDEDEGDED